MKNLLFSILLFVIIFNVSSQTLQNGNFEQWYIKTHYTYPDDWNITGIVEVINQTVFKDLDAYVGNYALKLKTFSESSYGFATLGDVEIDAQNNYSFKGAPCTINGDTLHLWYKSNIGVGDASLILVRLTKNGNLVHEEQRLLTGSNASWTHLKLAVNPLLLQIDSLFVGLTSSFPFGQPFVPSSDSWIIFDNIYFTQGTNPTPLNITNYSFENWSFAQSEEPADWLSSNAELISFQMLNVYKTFDAYSGTTALRMTNAPLNGDTVSGFLSNSTLNISSGGVPFAFKPDFIFGAYKYLPFNNDTAHLDVSFFKNGSWIGGEFITIYDSSNVYQTFQKPFSLFEFPDTMRIEISSGKNPNSVLFIDNIDFSCNRPINILISGITNNSASFTWEETGTASLWEVEYGVRPLTLGTGTVLQATSNHLTINNFNANTTYDFYVRALCDSVKISNWSDASAFTTLCNPVSVPVSENFENLNQFSMPECWQKIQLGSAQISAGGFNNFTSASNSLKVSLNPNDTALIIAPYVTENINLLQVSFQAKKVNQQNQAVLKIGAMSNVLDAGSFEILAVFNLTNDFNNYNFFLNNYSGSAHNLAFMITSNDLNEVYLDDIEVNYLPSCMPPVGVNAINITNNSAFIYWAPGGNELLWDVKYGLSGFDLLTEGQSLNGLTVSNTTIGGLLPGTPYDFYVRANCSGLNFSSWVKINFETLCLPFDVPFVQNFDNTLSGSIPNCWSVYSGPNSQVGVIDWGISTSGLQCLNINTGTADSAFIILPEINSDIDTLMLSFNARKDISTNAATIEIGIISNSLNVNTYVALSQFNLSDSFMPFVYLFNDYQGTDGYIALRLVSSSTAVVYIDDVEINFLPFCMPPKNIAVSNLADTSVQIMWSPGGSELLWDIKYGLSGFNPITEGQFQSGLTQNFVSINGLLPGNSYDFYVRANCGGNDSSMWTGISFQTLCLTFPLPLIQNFENTPIYNLPDCWNKYTSGFAQVNVVNWGISTSGSHSLNLNSGNADSTFIILPQTAFDIDTLMLSFNARKDFFTNSASLEIGTISNTLDINTYSSLSQIILNDSFLPFVYLFNNYQGTGERIILRLVAPSSAVVFIDDVEINFLPSCMPPYNIVVGNLSDTSAHLSWNSGGNETLWDIMYGFSGFDPLTEGQTIWGITQNDTTISDLTPGKLYDFYLRADCGNSDTSMWTKISFETLCLPFDIPLFESFESVFLETLPNCWQIFTSGGAQIFVSDFGVSTSGIMSLNVSAEIGDSALIVLPEASADLDTLIFTFNAKKENWTGLTSIEIGTVSNTLDISNYAPLSQFNISNSFKSFTFAFNNYQGTDKYIVLRILSQTSSSVFIDDISINYLPLCKPPYNINFSTISDSSVNVSWTPGGNELMWDVKYGITGFNPANEGQEILGLNQSNIIINGLNSGTLYDFYVRARCGASDSSIWMTADFQTTCTNVLLPLSENFDNTALNSLPICWNSDITGNSIAGTVNWAQPFSGDNCLRILNYEGQFVKIISPEFAQTVDTIYVGFHARKNPNLGDVQLIVGTMLNQTDSQSFMPVSTFNLSDQYNNYNTFFLNLTNQHHCVVFTLNLLGQDAEVFIDDISFDYVSECNAPINVDFNFINENSTSFSWQSVGPDTLWNLKYGPRGFDVQNEGTFIQGLNLEQYSISGLQTATSYDLYLQADCGSGMLSDWRGPYPFDTRLTSTLDFVNHLICPGDSNGIAHVSVSGGSPPYSYHWLTTPPQFGDTAFGLSGGPNIVKAQDANGFYVIDTIIISEPQYFNIEKIIDNVVCYNQSNGSVAVNITGGTSPYSYLWSNGSTNSQISGLSSNNYYLTITDAYSCKTFDTITISQPDEMIVTPAIYNNISCRGYHNGKIAVGVTGGTQPYSYIWNTNPVVYDSVVTNLGVGFYKVTVTDANNCIKVRTYSITQPGQALNASIIVNNALCANDSTGSIVSSAVGGTPPYSYLWSNGATTPGILNINGGNYMLTITDYNGCLFVDTANVKQPEISFSKTDVLCNGLNTGNITLKLENFIHGFNILWTNNIDSVSSSSFFGGAYFQYVNFLSAGTYFVEVSDSMGCTVSGSVTINQPQPMSVTVSKTDLLCFGNSNASISLSPQILYPPYTYLWNNGATTNSVNNLSSGTYFFTVTDGLLCKFTDSVNIISPPQLSFAESITDNLCKGDSAGSINLNTSGGTPPYFFLWSNAGDSAVATNLVAGNYSVTVTDSNFCSYSDAFTINEPDSFFTLTSEVIDNLCYGDTFGSINVIPDGGVAPYSYLWNNGQTSNQVYNLSAGDYIITITDYIGCKKIDTVTVLQPLVPFEIHFQTTSYICEGDTSGGALAAYTSGGTPPFYFIWSNNQNTTEIINLSLGTYTLTVVDGFGCLSIDSFIVQPLIINIDSIYGSSNVDEDSVEIYYIGDNPDQLNFNWSVINGTIINGNGQNTDTVLVLWDNSGSGLINIIATDTNGCSAEKSIIINIIPSSKIFYIEDIGFVHIYPNPFQDVLNVDFERTPDLKLIKLYDANARFVSAYEVNTSNSYYMVNIKKGVFFLKIGQSMFPLIKN
ncbi:MAG: fibronectin type III domain-containing protein [Bacteroidales bacterium]|nr:fibronectin type III domain-containing protein [Bacteroidales bacterium]